MEYSKISLRDNLKKAIIESRLSQKYIADGAGVSHCGLSNYLNSNKEFHTDIYERIMNFIGTKLKSNEH